MDGHTVIIWFLFEYFMESVIGRIPWMWPNSWNHIRMWMVFCNRLFLHIHNMNWCWSKSMDTVKLCHSTSRAAWMNLSNSKWIFFVEFLSRFIGRSKETYISFEPNDRIDWWNNWILFELKFWFESCYQLFGSFTHTK